MGSGNIFKTIISLKKVKDKDSKRVKGLSAPLKINGFKSKLRNPGALDMPIEDFAAIRIQTAFRAYKARKRLHRLKGMVKLQSLTQTYSVSKQAKTTLRYLHTWSRIQGEIKGRRSSMVREGRLKQKKLVNQLKFEAKLQDLEVDWCGGRETMEEILTRVYQREEATVKRERSLAYAFAHQWRANSNPLGLGNYELGKATWGWSWVERWVAARPWELRAPAQPAGLKKGQAGKPPTPKKQVSMTSKKSVSLTPKKTVPVKTSLSNGNVMVMGRRWSYPGAEKPAGRNESIEARELREKNRANRVVVVI